MWQPVETAPRDGTRVLLYWPSWAYEFEDRGDRPLVPIGWWTTNYRMQAKPGSDLEKELRTHGVGSESYFTDQNEQDCYGQAQVHNAPSHWQPLPDAPK